MTTISAAPSAALDGLFQDESFQPLDGAVPRDRDRLSYQRLRAIREAIPLNRALIDDPARLHPLLERAAICDPSLFHLLAIHLYAGLGIISRYGGDSAPADVVAALESGAATATVLVTEAGYGNSHIAQRTEAVFDPVEREFVLHTPDDAARKQPSTCGLPGIAKIGVVFARLIVSGVDRGVFAFAVRLRDETGPCPGVRITPLPPAPMLPADYASVSFDKVRVPYSGWLSDGATLGADGDFHDPEGGHDARLVRTMRFVADMQTAASVGLSAVSRVSIATAIGHSRERVTMGRLRPGIPVIRYRTQQRALFSALATAYAMKCRTDQIRLTPVNLNGTRGESLGSTPWSAVGRAHALTKAWVSEAADRILSICRLQEGARGFLTERYLEYQGMAQAYAAAGGSIELTKLDAAKAMAEGIDYRPPESGLPNPTDRDLLDQELWRHLLRRREQSLHLLLAERTAGPEGDDPFTRWNDQLPLAKTLTEAHLDRVALEHTLTAARQAPLAFRAGIDALCAYLALECISQHSGWYLCARLLSPNQVIPMEDTLNQLCTRIEPNAHTLTEFLTTGLHQP